jgi:hypothetical protein
MRVVAAGQSVDDGAMADTARRCGLLPFAAAGGDAAERGTVAEQVGQVSR